MTERDLRVQLVETCRTMSRMELSTGTSGNVSARLGDGMLISPTGIGYDVLAPDQVVRLDAAQIGRMATGDGFDGPVLPSSEWRFHHAILTAQPGLHAVVHTHSLHATAVSILGRAIPAIHYNIAAAGGATIPCAPYATFGTEALAVAVVGAMQDRRACLLAHHGAVAAGVTLAKALALAETVEELARLYLLCLPLGEPPILPDAEIAVVLEKYRTYGQQRPG